MNALAMRVDLKRLNRRMDMRYFLRARSRREE
jgi:hypothetical protein